MSILLDQMNGHYEGSVLDVSSQMSEKFNRGENLGQNKRLSAFNLQHMEKTQSDCMAKVSIHNAEIISEKETKQLCKEKSDSCDSNTKQQSSFTVSKNNTLVSPKNQQGISLKVNHILVVALKYIMTVRY